MKSWVFYDHPSDFPDVFVARMWDGLTPTKLAIMGDDLDVVRDIVMTISSGLTQLPINPDNDRTIVELWA